MEQLDPLRAQHPSRRVTESRRWTFSIVLPAVAAVLLLIVVRAKLRGEDVPTVLMVAVATGLVAVMLLGTRFLIRALREHRESEARFQQMASNIQEIFWMIDAETKKALYVNDAYQTITGRSCQSLTDNPTSYEDVIHPDERAHVLAKLDEATRTGQFNERFRIVSTHGEERWVTVHGFPVRDAAGKIWRLVGTAQEITEQKKAEDQVVKNLGIAEAAGRKRRRCVRRPWRSPKTCIWISLWMRYSVLSKS
jgi:PAS domain S-box-containing protein